VPILLVVLAAGACGWRFGPWLAHLPKMQALQRPCAAFAAPAEQVVYEEDPTAAAALLRSGPDYVDHRPVGRFTPVAAFVPACWAAYWREVTYLGAANDWPYPVLFLGERSSPKGHRRIITVTAPGTLGRDIGHDLADMLEGIAIEPGSILHRPRNRTVPKVWGGHDWIHRDTGPYVRFWAGQIDPADPSHFTIRYEQFGGGPGWDGIGTIDGTLRDEDDVDLYVRDGPAKVNIL
jgi:hypothetical protein